MTKGTHSLYGSYVSPQRLAHPFLLSCYSLDSLGRHQLNPRSLFYCTNFSPPAQLSPVFHLGSINLQRFLSLLCHPLPPLPIASLSSFFLSLGFGPPHDATFSLGRHVLRLWLLIIRCVTPFYLHIYIYMCVCVCIY